MRDGGQTSLSIYIGSDLSLSLYIYRVRPLSLCIYRGIPDVPARSDPRRAGGQDGPLALAFAQFLLGVWGLKVLVHEALRY